MLDTSNRRAIGRRTSDITREMLEESMKELPAYFVTVLDDERGMYSFYYADRGEADLMVSSLKKEGVPADRIGVYQRLAR